MKKRSIKIVLCIAASLDGYIARPDGSVDWLDSYQTEGEDYGYGEFYESIDALMMGRETYEIVRNLGDWPYADKSTYVLTQQELSSDNQRIIFTSKDPISLSRFFQSQGYEKIWLAGGGQLAASFLKYNLIDEIILSLIPICLGEGVPLFPNNSGSQKDFTLIDTKSYSSGIVQIHYRKNDQ